jgi:hypothetical protein
MASQKLHEIANRVVWLGKRDETRDKRCGQQQTLDVGSPGKTRSGAVAFGGF